MSLRSPVAEEGMSFSSVDHVNDLADVSAREQAIRVWIANKESVCPYAPGTARYEHLPAALSSENAWAMYFGKVLKSFYKERVKGKRVERLILLPPQEWATHQEARDYSTQMFWRVAAGYHSQTLTGKKYVRQILARESETIQSCDEQGVSNPVIGKHSAVEKGLPHYKSMFFSSFSPLYHSNQFFRYAPSSALVLVSALALHKKREKNEQTMSKINDDILLGCVNEATRGKVELDASAIIAESKDWETILFQTYQQQAANWKNLPQPGLAQGVNQLQPELVNQTFSIYQDRLPVLNKVCSEIGSDPARFLKAIYLHAGLYVMPRYVA